MMFTCAARASGSTKVVRSRNGKSLRVDIHGRYLNAAVAARVAHLNPAQYEPSVTFANALTREVNVKQIHDRLAEGARRRPFLASHRLHAGRSADGSQASPG